MTGSPLTFFLVANAVAVGMLSGWWLRTTRLFSNDAGDDQRRERTERLTEQLRQLTVTVAEDVGQHHERVQEINDVLSVARDHDSPEAVVSAVSQLIETNERMQQQLRDAELKLEEQAQQMASHVEAALTDALTNLANRRAMDEELQRCINAVQEDGQPATVMLVDVDHFKKFNDTYGHQAGDEVLQGVARGLRRSLAKYGCVARYGGEEFAVVFAGKTLTEVMQRAEFARLEISEAPSRFEDQWLIVTASAGLSEICPEDDATTLLKRADDALYASKEAGRNCAHWHDGANILPIVAEEAASTSEMEGPAADGFGFPGQDGTCSLPSDVLERVSDRTVFCQDIARRLAEWKRGGAPLALLLIQLRDIESVRQQYGQRIERLLQRVVAQLTQAAMRDIDHLGKIDDTTFALLLPGARLPDAVAVGRKLLKGAGRRELSCGQVAIPLVVHLSAVESSTRDTMQHLLRRANEGLVAARQSGDCCGVQHDGETASRFDSTPPMEDVPAEPQGRGALTSARSS